MNLHPFTRALLLAAALLAVLPLAARPAAQDDLYLVTLDPVAAIDGVETVAARLAATYGGTVADTADAAAAQVVMRLPASRARLLAKDTSVASMSAIAAANAAPAEVVDWTAGVSYSYDPSGNVRSIGKDAFAYDTANRLVGARVNDIRRGYSYDAVGNRTGCAQPEGNCQPGVTISSSDNRINEATYDAAGNMERLGSSTYTYDALNMQSHASTNGAGREFLYTADDERLAIVDHRTGTWRWTVRDRSNKVLREFTSNGATAQSQWQWTKDFVWRDGLLLATRQTEATNATTYHYHLDHLGTPRRITNATDRLVGFHDYHAFGPELSGGLNEPSPTAMKYTGHERDSSFDGLGALDYMHARYYDPMMGRFLSVDPLVDVKKNIAEPQRWNRYVYVVSSPLRYIDPDGRDLMIVYDFRGSGLTIQQQNAIMQAVRRRFVRAGVKNVSSYIAGGTKPKAEVKTDQVTYIRVTSESIGKDRTGAEIQGKTPWPGTKASVSTFPARGLNPAELMNYVVNVVAHEVGHASRRLTHHDADLGSPRAGSIMSQMPPKDRGAQLRDFDPHDSEVLRRELNEQ